MRSSATSALPRSTNSFLVWWSRLFLFVGLAAIGWVAYVWVEARFYQIRQRRQFDASASAENKEPSAVVRMPLTHPS